MRWTSPSRPRVTIRSSSAEQSDEMLAGIEVDNPAVIMTKGDTSSALQGAAKTVDTVFEVPMLAQHAHGALGLHRTGQQ